MTDVEAKTAKRPDFAVEPEPGQESVWDYPRPPALRRDSRLIEVRDGDVVLARTTAGFKVMETASPPTFYIPPADVALEQLVRLDQQTYCEWKGSASYWALARSPGLPVAWSYERPRPSFAAIQSFIAFYPERVTCLLADEQVRAQAGRFYGGWITSEVVGPFKGEPGTGHW